MVRRVAVITATRAEYGLLRPLLSQLQASELFELQLIVGGTHLKAEFGQTWKEIVADGFEITERVCMSTDTATALTVANSAASAVSGFASAFDRLRPELLVLLGDRFEVVASALAATLFNIPIAHLHGGESTLGASDEVFRHAITKMAHLHFTATETYRRRVIQLGESPDRVFNVGALGLDSVRTLPLLSREQLDEALGLNPFVPYVVLTYHPETRRREEPSDTVDLLVNAVLEVPGLNVICTGANADVGGQSITRRLEDHRARCPDRVKLFPSLGQLNYFSAIKYSRGVLGNSSSAIIEVPSLHVGSLDIGDRQAGRLRASSVLHASANMHSIRDGMCKLLALETDSETLKGANPYGDGHTSSRIISLLSNCSWPLPVAKPFHDLASDGDL
jgi:UDP-hydrolysing UDP-N-acetyl-D-glucosamine 2-epimerase